MAVQLAYKLKSNGVDDWCQTMWTPKMFESGDLIRVDEKEYEVTRVVYDVTECLHLVHVHEVKDEQPGTIQTNAQKDHGGLARKTRR